jgi:hypothetical protein
MIYRDIMNMPMSIPESKVIQIVADRYKITPEKAGSIAERVSDVLHINPA